jgi:hypothetical protein
MWPWDENLKLGKASAFVKRDIRSLPLTEAEFEADFFLDPEFSTKRREAWIGLVVERESGDLLAMEDVRWPPPTVNDLAALLAHAMERPPDYEDRRRPRTIYLRDRPQWQELLPHLRQLGMEVVLGDDLPRFDQEVVEWMRERSARHTSGKLLPSQKIQENLKSPFPERKRTSADAVLDLLRWTDEMLKAGYPSARKGTPAKYDPDSTVTIHLTAEELQAILTQTDIAKTKKLRPRLEAMAAEGRSVELGISDWSTVLLALCGARAKAIPIRKHLLRTATRMASQLADTLGIAPPAL